MRPAPETIASPSRAGRPVREDVLAQCVEMAGGTGTSIIVIEGPAGAGKTWLAQATLSAFPSSEMMVGRGKYSEGEGQAALMPIMAALSSLLEDALRRLYDPHAGIASLADTLGVDLDVLISAGLAAPGLVARTDVEAMADRRRSVTRITTAALNLLGWTEKFGLPRALLIDDWHRAPPDAIELVRAMTGAAASRPLTLLLTQRGTAGAHPAFADVPVVTHRLGALDDGDIARLLAQSLGGEERSAPILADLGSSMPRLPLDIIQTADAFVRSGALHRVDGRWEIDSAKSASLAIDADTRIGALEPETLRLVTGLALWGDSAPERAVRAALGDRGEGDIFFRRVDELDALGIVRRDGGMIVFRHDKLRRAALERAPADMLAALSGAMAERLDPENGETEAMALRLRLGGGLETTSAGRWRDRFARGAVAARGRGDSDGAAHFAEAALALRDRQPPDDHEMERMILREAVLAAADRDDPLTEARARALIASARSTRESYDDYETAIVALRLAEQTDAAWRMACEGLRHVGIRPPGDRPIGTFLVAALRWWWSRRRDRSAPLVPTDMPTDAFARVAVAAATLAYHRSPRSTALIAFRASVLADRLSRRSAYWQSVDTFLFAAIGAQARAADAGERALESFGDQQVLRAATLYQALFFGVHWRRSLKSQRPRFREVARIALNEGDLITACYGLRIFVMSGWRTTSSLDTLLEEAIAARNTLRGLGEASFLDEMEAMVAMLKGLTGATHWDPAVWRDDLPTRNHVIDLELANLAGDWPETLRRAKLLRPLWRDYSVQADSVVLRFHETLARLRCGIRARYRDLRLLRRAAALNPADHLAKLHLIEAEGLRVGHGRIRDTLLAYAGAVDAAMRTDSRLDAALAATCAGDYASSVGQHDLSRMYHERADTIYREWGARAKVGAARMPAPDILAEAEARARAAERADQAKSRLLAHVGHELRTPLQALQALLELAKGGDAPADMEEIRAVLASLTAVIDDLDIIEGAPGDQGGAMRGVDLEDLLRSEIAIWRADSGMSLTVEGPAAPVDVAADRIRQIVRNLLSNAVKYGEGSPVAVELRMAPSEGDALRVTISVRDGGAGIAPHDLERLFEPFERGGFAGDGRGLGLGLALSRRIADRLGAVLDATNHPGGGVRFDLKLTARRSAAAPGTGGMRAATILLVEDSALIRHLIGSILRRDGHHVIDVSDAAEALAAWHGGDTVDLAILDIGLPDASGLSVMREMRESGVRGASLPVILLTASRIDGVAEEMRHDRATRVLRKPASTQTLRETIAALLGLPADTTPRPSRGPAVDDLFHAARSAVEQGGQRCLSAVPDAASCHQLAGLAAQFGWEEAGTAFEDLSVAIRAGEPLDMPRARVAAALAAMN